MIHVEQFRNHRYVIFYLISVLYFFRLPLFDSSIIVTDRKIAKTLYHGRFDENIPFHFPPNLIMRKNARTIGYSKHIGSTSALCVRPST